jgi:hypothetical protein
MCTPREEAAANSERIPRRRGRGSQRAHQPGLAGGVPIRTLAMLNTARPSWRERACTQTVSLREVRVLKRLFSGVATRHQRLVLYGMNSSGATR